MTIKIVGNEQVICDCTGNTPETYQERLLVGIVRETGRVTLQLYCPKCKTRKSYTVRAQLVLDMEPV